MVYLGGGWILLAKVIGPIGFGLGYNYADGW